jgi:Universal stress protein family
MKVSKTPVPVRRGLSPRPMRSRIQRILATTDFSDESLAGVRYAADLIVIATHGYTGAKRVLLGSTAERVVRHAQCPVLVVRDRKAKSN